MTVFSSALDDVLRVSGIGIKIEVTVTDSAGTATTKNTSVGRQAAIQDHALEAKHLWIPGAAAEADQKRTVDFTAYSGGTTTLNFNETANFGENLADETAYLLAVHPDFIIDAANQTLERLKTRVEVPLSHFPDSGDMQGSDVDTDWTESAATDTVQTTSGEVLRGAQSLVVTDNGSGGGYTESGSHRVGQGKAITVHFEAKADTGTGEIQVIDGDSNEQADIVFTEEQWVYGYERVTFDSDDETFTLRLVSVGANDEVDWQRVWGVRHGEYTFQLPSWIGDRHVIKALVARRYLTRSADSGSSDNLYLAESYDDDMLFEGVHYEVYKRPSDVHTRILRLIDQGRSYIERPLFLIVASPYSDPYGVSTVVSSYTSEANISLDLWTAGTLKYLGMSQEWTDVVENAEMTLREIYHEDEVSQFTKPRSAAWTGPGWWHL